MCSTFNFTSPRCQHWIFSVHMFDKQKDLWSLQWIHRHRQLLHESHPFDKFLLSFFCCSSTFCLLLLWCTAHLERCDTSNFEVTKVFFLIFHMLSTDFNRFCFTIFTKLHNPICHFALVGLLHHGHLSFSKNSDLGSKKFRWFYQAVEAPVILFNDVSEMVFKASYQEGTKEPTNSFLGTKIKNSLLKSWSLHIFKYNTIGNFEISNFHKLLNYTSTSLLVCPGSNGNHWLESIL